MGVATEALRKQAKEAGGAIVLLRMHDSTGAVLHAAGIVAQGTYEDGRQVQMDTTEGLGIVIDELLIVTP